VWRAGQTITPGCSTFTKYPDKSQRQYYKISPELSSVGKLENAKEKSIAGIEPKAFA
jgi:hypothetical protein